MKNINIFCFGFGQVAKNFIKKLSIENYNITLTTTSRNKSSKENFKGVNYKVKYSGQFDRMPGQYDFLSEGQEYLDDLKKLNFYAVKKLPNNTTVSFTALNLTNEQAEVLPYYNNKGREFNLTIQYNW